MARTLYFFLFVSVVTYGFQYCSGSEVAALTHETFIEHASTKTGYVLFYAPWCNHCSMFMPIWQKLAEEEDYAVSKIDCSVKEHAQIAADNRIKGYPTIKFHHEGKFYTYPYKRRIQPLKDFAEHILSGHPEVEPHNVVLRFPTFTDFLKGMLNADKYIAFSATAAGGCLGVVVSLILFWCCFSSDSDFDKQVKERLAEIDKVIEKQKTSEDNKKPQRKKNESKNSETKSEDSKPIESKKDR
mmetsp:Transcript_11331/g.13118  ORF Transcript_11331/g.13118 Transcript_11331/m.13118 type:complete len:242 (-) Transcript_11331:21-746(-)